jgi:hypothetical protein
LWSLVAWSFFGGAITRVAAMRLGRDERVGLRESVAFARQKLVSYVGAPLLPLLAIMAMTMVLLPLGLLMRSNLGVALAGLTWAAVGLTGFVMALFAIGLLFGWPLMWSTISTEGSDAFDAVSRSYAYTFQRPLQYLAYAGLSLLLGIGGWLVVTLFCTSIIALAEWGISWGSGTARLNEIRSTWTASAPADRQVSESGPDHSPSDAGQTQSALVRFGGRLIAFFNGLVRSFQLAYSYSYFWVAAAGIYLLLRRDADQTEIDDVHVDDETEASYGLPPLSADKAGVPGVVEEEGPAPSSAEPHDGPPS